MCFINSSHTNVMILMALNSTIFTLHFSIVHACNKHIPHTYWYTDVDSHIVTWIQKKYKRVVDLVM